MSPTVKKCYRCGRLIDTRKHAHCEARVQGRKVVAHVYDCTSIHCKKPQQPALIVIEGEESNVRAISAY